jgi:hypothetical protein
MTKIGAYERETVERRLGELKQRFYSLADLECDPLQRSSQLRALLAEIKALRSALETGTSAESEGLSIRQA